MSNERIGEIIETTSTGFVAESFELNRPPALGSLVVVSVSEETGASPGTHLCAVVTYGQTAGLDPSRRAVRRSTDTVVDGAVYREHPELKHILRTEFGATLVGFIVDGTVRQHLPSLPPPLHYSVHKASAEQVQCFTNRLQYLRLLLAARGEVPVPQVLAANIREVYQQRSRDRAWLDAAAQEVATLLKDDHQALLTVLYAIDPGLVSAQ
jgi:hypothetical protein